MTPLSKSLTELEGVDWGMPLPEAPPYLHVCHELRYKSLNSLTVEDLRILIGQDVGLRYLMPMAFELLDVDPLAKGKHYAGDLLVSVLGVGGQYFSSHPDERIKAERILAKARRQLSSLDDFEQECLNDALREVEAKFSHPRSSPGPKPESNGAH